ncbi:MAG: GxxExxY protein [Saprospiraceae bacterium]|nr:GxxExxY protein [Saprospiraceae bacterium]
MKHEELTSRIIGICIKVHSILGPGLLESVYEEALCFELTRQGISFLRQQGVKVNYEDVQLGLGFRADVIVENTIVLELKSVEAVAPVHAKTVITYLKFTGIEVGLLINFNVALLKDGITRLIRDNNTKLTP